MAEKSRHLRPSLAGPDTTEPGSVGDGLIMAPLEALRPTQMSVGMRAVTHKRRKFERRIKKFKGLDNALRRRPIPAVRGPRGELFIVDHHHLGLALWQAEIQNAYVRVIGDFSGLRMPHFWQRMQSHGWLHPFDEEGRPVAPYSLPSWLHAMRHDPFRDLAWEVREAGGFEKSHTPFAEFRWAHYFRARISLAAIREDPSAVLNEAMKLARTRAAADLPGWIERARAA